MTEWDNTRTAKTTWFFPKKGENTTTTIRGTLLPFPREVLPYYSLITPHPLCYLSFAKIFQQNKLIGHKIYKYFFNESWYTNIKHGASLIAYFPYTSSHIIGKSAAFVTSQKVLISFWFIVFEIITSISTTLKIKTVEIWLSISTGLRIHFHQQAELHFYLHHPTC